MTTPSPHGATERDEEIALTPESELLHWGREEEFDNPTGLFQVEFGNDLRYWVSAEDAADALMLVKTNGEDEDLMGETCAAGASVEVKSLTLDEANAKTFLAERESVTMAAEFNRDPRPRVTACSEWTP